MDPEGTGDEFMSVPPRPVDVGHLCSCSCRQSDLGLFNLSILELRKQREKR